MPRSWATSPATDNHSSRARNDDDSIRSTHAHDASSARIQGFNALETVSGFLEVIEPQLTGISNAFNALRTVNGSLFVSGGEAFGNSIIRGGDLQSIVESFGALESTELLTLNMTAPADLTDSFGALTSVEKCCTLYPSSLASELPACVDICDDGR